MIYINFCRHPKASFLSCHFIVFVFFQFYFEPYFVNTTKINIFRFASIFLLSILDLNRTRIKFFIANLYNLHWTHGHTKFSLPS